MRYLSRGRPEGSRRSAQNRWPAAGIYRPATYLHSEWNERGHCGGVDEESGREFFRGRYYLDLGLPGVAPAEVNRRPIVPPWTSSAINWRRSMLPSKALKDRRAFLKFLAASPIMAYAGFTSGWVEDLMADDSIAPQNSAALGAQNEVVIKSVKEALNVFDFDAVARTKLSTAHYTFITDGSFNNETVRANREGFSKYQIRLRRLTGITKVDQSIHLFGATWESPIFLCPVGRMNARS